MNPLYLLIDHASGYIKEKNGIKYLVFDSTDENKEVFKKNNNVWNGIRDKIKEISGSECDYEKYYMKINFNSNDNLPLNKPLKFHLMTIIIRCIFSEGGKFYPQIFLGDTLYELNIKIFFYNFFLLYIKMSEIADLTYQKSQNVILNKKDYYKNDKERLREQARDKYKNLSEEEKKLKKEYGKNRFHSVSEEKKQRLKEYQKNDYETKKSQYNNE